ncbi:hypothetical protein [Buchnera aphidicola]|uniref:hypothetical protein n=1 Tax=Buchnera aphidicola TaxID=9 RepID=UPI003463F7D1
MIKKITITKINCYFILEEDFFLANEVQEFILQHYKKKQYDYIIKIIIKSNDTWNKVYREYQQTDFFFKKKILLIILKKIKKNYNLYQILQKIQKYNNTNIILLIRITNKNYDNNSIILKNIVTSNQIIIDCPYLTIQYTKIWIRKIIHTIKLNLCSEIIALLSYNYERNLLMLFKILEIFKIISLNHKITKKYVQEILSDNVSFSIKHWIYALFSKNHMQAIRMLNFFKKNKYNISYLIRSIQKNLIYLIHIKENYLYKNYLCSFQQDIIFHDNTLKLKTITKNISYKKIFQTINILKILEINNKNHKHELLWEYIKKIIFIFSS